jgi:hypothetical protein
MTLTRSPLRLLVLLAAVALCAPLLSASPAQAATPRVTSTYFGMTDSTPTSWPATRVGSIRLWDSGVTWRHLETSPGVFDFTNLDQQVAVARSHGARPLLTLGSTPRFHATKPNQAALYGRGSASMPRLWAWERYVRKVVSRYGTKVDYQVWNEANVQGFWTGTPRQLAKLTQVTSKIVNANAPAAKLVSPSLGTRLSGQRLWLRNFYAQTVGGRRVARWVDVVSLHLYPLPSQGPEAAMKQLAAARSHLRALGVNKPIWNTEVNYGIQVGGGGTAKDISSRREAALLTRTYVLNIQNGVYRVYWYSWDLQRFANTFLTTPAGALTQAGVAFGVVRTWLQGTRASGCSRSSNGTYTCTFKYGSGVKRVYWNPSRKASVQTVSSATRLTYQTGGSTAIRGGKRIGVDFAPVMVRSRR